MSSIKPVRFEVTCCAWECSPDSDRVSPPLTQPLMVDATSAAQAGKVAQQHGWRPAPGRGYWWCPQHVAIAARRRTELAG